ncbi:terminase small subunit [Staphylococcus phage vB_SepS_SEP9]|uniref:Terminase small subunit n=1 Tax=Staphylococcus phage vB_SepS_SEP9 TaxID=1434319 RepID=W5RV58_9CAUD|nr:terminase small subunit [Staphylococcus phage vB_SepS_SEP9]AHG23919.1 terminase small subunit [Staphylococcus phage vB_SepS_SEP9]
MSRGRPKAPAQLVDPSKNHRYNKSQVEQMKKSEDELKGKSEKVSDIPEYLSDLAKEYYSFIVNEMEVSGVLSNLDIPVVVQISETLAIIRKCDADIQSDGLWYYEPDRNGRNIKKKNPSVDIRDKALNQFKQLAVQLGMTPSSRSSLAAANIEKQEKEEDPLLKVLNQK